jgi:hypothetical protein
MAPESPETRARKTCASREVLEKLSLWPINLSFLAMLADGRILNELNKAHELASPLPQDRFH